MTTPNPVVTNPHPIRHIDDHRSISRMDWALLRRLDHGGMHEEADPMPMAMPPSAGHEHHMVMVREQARDCGWGGDWGRGEALLGRAVKDARLNHGMGWPGRWIDGSMDRFIRNTRRPPILDPCQSTSKEIVR